MIDTSKAKPMLFTGELADKVRKGVKTVTRRPLKRQPWISCEGTEFECRHEKGFYDTGGNNWACRKCGQGIGPPPYRNGRVSLFNTKYQVGDIVYVRETWGNWNYDDPDCNACYYQYRADYPDGAKDYEWPELDEFGEKIICDLPKWHPSIHMPKEAARTFLRITAVRVERLQDITEEQAFKEGIQTVTKDYILSKYCVSVDDWVKNYKHIHKGDWWVNMPRMPQIAYSFLWDKLTPKKDLERYGWNANPWVFVYEWERVEV